jgi:hypothetical protein
MEIVEVENITELYKIIDSIKPENIMYMDCSNMEIGEDIKITKNKNLKESRLIVIQV